MNLKSIVRRSVGLLPSVGGQRSKIEPKQPKQPKQPKRQTHPTAKRQGPVKGKLRRVDSAIADPVALAAVSRAFVTRAARPAPPLDYADLSALRRESLRSRRAPRQRRGQDNGLRVRSHDGALARSGSRADLVMTVRAAVRRSVGLQNAPQVERAALTPADAIAAEQAKAQSRGPAINPAGFLVGREAVPGFVDPQTGQRWTSREAFEKWGHKGEPKAIPMMGPDDMTESNLSGGASLRRNK